MEPREMQYKKGLGVIKVSRALCFAMVYGTQLIYIRPALAHGGEDHSRDREKPSAENIPLNVLEPSEKTDSTTAPGQSEGEILIQEELPTPALPPDPASAFSLGAVGLGEVLFILIITGPFLLRTLKYRLHS